MYMFQLLALPIQELKALPYSLSFCCFIFKMKQSHALFPGNLVLLNYSGTIKGFSHLWKEHEYCQMPIAQKHGVKPSLNWVCGDRRESWILFEFVAGCSSWVFKNSSVHLCPATCCSLQACFWGDWLIRRARLQKLGGSIGNQLKVQTWGTDSKGCGLGQHYNLSKPAGTTKVELLTTAKTIDVGSL